MKYPIFDSIIKNIENEITKRGIVPSKFKVWKESTIQATGLELTLDIQGHSSGVKEITINFDWDSFREAKLAHQMKGMKKHPLVKRKDLIDSKVALTLDIETAWHFDEEQITRLETAGDADARIRYASEWMKALNNEISLLTPLEKSINRWHIEVDGDKHGKFLSAMSLLTYQQYALHDITELGEIHAKVTGKLQAILSRSLRILELAGRTRPEAA
ncbi:MAG: hypothetical protein LAT84_00720 [Balneolia bacterium]|nr:hypothetical protein [Balneolia bacterium]